MKKGIIARFQQQKVGGSALLCGVREMWQAMLFWQAL